MTNLVSPATAYKRISRGWDHDDAWTCPTDVPLWAWRAEKADGRPLADTLRDAARAADVTGETLSSIAADYGVSEDKMGHYSRRLGIRWPRGVSRVQRESASRVISEYNRRAR